MNIVWENGVGNMRQFRKFLSVSALLIGCGAMLMGGDMPESGAIAAMSLLLWPWNFAKEPQTENIQNLENDPHHEPLGKARADYAMIQGNIGLLRDKTMAAQVERLQVIAGKMLTYLDSHPERIPAAMRFIDYYQDRTAALIRQYVSLRKTGLQTQEMENLQCNMRTTFQGFAVAYEKQFAEVIDHEILDMDAEMKVARQVMQGDGIDCNKLEAPVIPPGNDDADKESKKETGWNLKHAGIAIGAVALGAVGLWKLFGGDNEKSG